MISLMRRLALALSFTATLLFQATEANAKDIHSFDAINHMAGKLLVHAQNFTNMSDSLSGKELSISMELYSVAMSALSRANEITDLLYLRSAMVNSADSIEVQGVLKENKDSFMKECSEDLSHITAQIAFSYSPAVVSEGEHLRDDLTLICERVSSLK